MIIGIIGLMVLMIFTNIVFYEYRVIKGLFGNPKYITPAYARLLLKRKYK